MFRSILERNCTVYTRLKLKLYNFRHSLFDPTKYKKVKYVMVVNIYGYKHLCLHSSAEIRRKMPYGGTISNYVTTPRYQYPQVPIPPVPIPPGTNTPRYQWVSKNIFDQFGPAVRPAIVAYKYVHIYRV